MVSPEVLDAAERWTSSRISACATDLRSNLQAWLAPQLSRVGDVEWGAQIRDLVQLPVDDPLEWANRWIELPEGEWAVAGIRFRARDIQKPFVDIIATSLAPDPAGIDALGDVLPHFGHFAPLALRVAAPDPHALCSALRPWTAEGGRADVDLFVVAGRTSEVRAPAAPDAEFALTRADPQAAADRVGSIYRELAASRPRIDQWAAPADLDTLRGAADEQLLFEVVVDGLASGVVAAARDDAYGFTGHSVQEICLDAAHRGRGFGPAALEHLAQALPAPHGSEVLWGHVHPENSASLRNARAVGREIVGGHVWISPAEYPGMSL